LLEDYAFHAVFVDSDFHGGGTNNKGHYILGGHPLDATGLLVYFSIAKW